MDRVAHAVQLFRDGCVCSQAIAASYGPALGWSDEMALRIASGFAGG
jgi:hypothetical protein